MSPRECHIYLHERVKSMIRRLDWVDEVMLSTMSTCDEQTRRMIGAYEHRLCVHIAHLREAHPFAQFR